MNFRGRSQRSLDQKGRFMLSPEYRESLCLRMQNEKKTFFAPQNTTVSDTKPSNQEECSQETGLKVEASVRTELKEEIKVVITTYDKCLVAYSLPDWLKIEEQFEKIQNPSPNVRAFKRLFIGGSDVQVIDAQGRIRLSQEHREYAKLDKEIIVLGLINRFEIWNPALLDKNIEEIDFSAVSDELNDSGIDFAF